MCAVWPVLGARGPGVPWVGDVSKEWGDSWQWCKHRMSVRFSVLLDLEISVPSKGPGVPRVSDPALEGGIVSSALDRSSVLQCGYRVSEKDREQDPVGRVSNTAPVGGRVSSALVGISEQQCERTVSGKDVA